jgi:(R,R)-butanediol dehydrogenase / meso-butanediol dehydrogenase / diacetyl reductase
VALKIKELSMKAANYYSKGDIRVDDCPPVIPGQGQVRIEVAWCGICGSDLHAWHGKMDHRVKPPQPIGHECSGRVAEIGPGVSGFAIGEKVVVRPLDPCNECPACKAGHSHICQKLKFMGLDTPGAFQQSWTVPAHTLHKLPEAMPLDVAALIEPLAVASHDVRMGEVKKGEYAVVIGGGPIGILVAMVARDAGARVLLAEVNQARLRFAAELGFETIDPNASDVVAHVESATGTAGADVVFEVSGSQPGISLMTKLGRTRGRVVMVAIVSEPKSVDLFRVFWRELRIIGARVYEPCDFEKAIAFASGNTQALARLITSRKSINELGAAMDALSHGSGDMKVLIKLS